MTLCSKDSILFENRICTSGRKEQNWIFLITGRTKEEQDNYLDRLCAIRRNVQLILHYGTVIPFQWYTKGYRCFYCQKPMRDCESLKEHTVLKHHSVDLDNFIPQRIITKDIPVKVDISSVGCKICCENFNNLDDLTRHITEVHEENYDYTIGVCIFPFLLTKDIMPCCLCDAQYDNITCMVTHMYKEHITHRFICQICGLSFIDKVRLQRHITKSHIGHKCSLCQKVFDAFHKLEKHKQRIHGQIKTHECTLCTASFENGYQVKVHMGKVHNVEKYRIKCELCPKVTTTKGAMLLHVQSIHSDVRYECDLCDYKCGIKWMIKLHKRKHYGEKNYVCSVCSRKFGRSSNVRAHMKVHTGNVGRVCRWCKHGFTDLETLHKHEMESHYYHEYV
ncbi:zinc finger protein 26-like [Pectinophora gossypiella]|uniref:zinc finger protein 26-like n=1 Tax=Pectinophora gossypiella TaxID=13191 RepID=UPI00214EF9F0|nr:zinc finger protein 26-like [Pectinophora gossypiella]